MKGHKRIATWLELVSTVQRQRDVAPLRIHATGEGEDKCVVMTVDGRLLHDTSGRITIFQSVGAVIRFLAQVGGPAFSYGAPAHSALKSGEEAHCLCLRRGKRLKSFSRPIQNGTPPCRVVNA